MNFALDTIRIAPPYRERLRSAGLDTVERVLNRVDGQIIAWSRTTDSMRIAHPAAGPGFYVKRYFFPRWRQRLRGMLRGTFLGADKARLEFNALHELRLRGVPAVRPIAHGQRRLGHFLVAAFLITEEVPGAVNLTSFALDREHGLVRLGFLERRMLITTLARAIAAMHAEGYSHGNLYWRNILVRVGVDGAPEFFFVDPQPVPGWQRLPRNWYVRELTQLAVSAEPFLSRSEWLRFLVCYSGADGATPELRETVREITRQLSAGRSHERRRIGMTALFDGWRRALEPASVRPLSFGVGRL